MNYMFYGQGNADQILFEQYNINYKNGKFIEIGAFRGDTFSNTYFFEKELEWSGVLIEPGRSNFKMLSEFCTVNRPNSICLNYAVDYEEGQIEFLEKSGVGACKKYVDEKHVNNWNLSAVPIQVCRAAPMKNIITTDLLTTVDLFSIDVEGHELAVLETFNWDIPVKYVLIEKNLNYSLCEKFLIEKNFTLKGNVHINALWQNLNF